MWSIPQETLRNLIKYLGEPLDHPETPFQGNSSRFRPSFRKIHLHTLGKIPLRAYQQGHDRALRRARPTDRDRSTPRSPRSPLECLKNRDLKGTHHDELLTFSRGMQEQPWPVLRGHTWRTLHPPIAPVSRSRKINGERTLARSILHGARGSASVGGGMVIFKR